MLKNKNKNKKAEVKFVIGEDSEVDGSESQEDSEIVSEPTNNDELGSGKKSEKNKEPKIPESILDDPAVTSLLRRSFYKDGANLLKYSVLGSFVFMGFSIASVFYAIEKQPDRAYFAVGDDGRVLEMTPLSEPNMSDAAVGNWLTGALVDTFNFSYITIRDHLNKSTLRWFTDNGRQELLDSLENVGNFDAIIDRKLIVTATIDAVPLVLAKGKPGFSDGFLWRLEVPGTISYMTESNSFTNKVLFTITVSRVSELQNNSGLGIHRIVMERTK